MIPKSQLKKLDDENFNFSEIDIMKILSILPDSVDEEEMLEHFHQLRVKDKEVKAFILLLRSFWHMTEMSLQEHIKSNRIDTETLSETSMPDLTIKIFEMVFLFGTAAAALSDEERFALMLLIIPILFATSTVNISILINFITSIAQTLNLDFDVAFPNLLHVMTLFYPKEYKTFKEAFTSNLH